MEVRMEVKASFGDRRWWTKRPVWGIDYFAAGDEDIWGIASGLTPIYLRIGSNPISADPMVE